MTSDARRVLGQAVVASVFAARSKGGMCANCGRALTATEPIWVERLDVVDAGRRVGSYRGPVGRECASEGALREAAGRASEPCVGCGRGVYYRRGGPGRRPRWVTCSKRCADRYQAARRKEARGS